MTEITMMSGLAATTALVFTLQERVMTTLTSKCLNYYILRGAIAGLATSCLLAAYLVPSLPVLFTNTFVASISTIFNKFNK